MASGIQVNVDFEEQFKRLDRYLFSPDIRKISRSAINETGTKLGKFIRKDAAKNMGVRGNQIQARKSYAGPGDYQRTGSKMGAMAMVKRASNRDLSAVLKGRGGLMNLGRFEGTEVGDGYQASSRRTRVYRGVERSAKTGFAVVRDDGRWRGAFGTGFVQEVNNELPRYQERANEDLLRRFLIKWDEAFS